MNLFAFAGLACGISCSILAFVALIFGRTKIHRVLALFNISVGVWGFGCFMAGIASTEVSALVGWRFGQVGGIYLAVFFYHMVSLFVREKKRLGLTIIYLWSYFFTFFCFYSDFLFSKTRYIYGLYYNDATKLYTILVITWLIIVSISFVKILKFLTSAKGTERIQAIYIIFGFLIGFIGGSSTLIPMFGFLFPPFGNLTIPLYCLIATYAILRHRLLDINIVFTRASIFVAVYSLVLGIPLILIYALQNQLAIIFGVSWWIVPYFCTIALSTLGPFIYFYVNERAEARLMREQKSYQNILRDASSGMIRIKDLGRLLNLIVRVVAKTVRINHVFIYLLIPEEQKYRLFAHRGKVKLDEISGGIDLGSPLVWQLTMKKEPIVAEEQILRQRDDSQNLTLGKMVEQINDIRASLIVPSFIEDRLIGILVLGEKRSGKLYSQDDVAVFSVLANQAALAIENAQFYHEIKQTHEQLFQAEKMATIGTMADGLSHQINNRFHALSLIAGDSLDILKTFDNSGCNDEAKQYLQDLRTNLERIEANVVQGVEVVKGLLKYSRPGETGFEQIDLKDVLNGAIDMLQYKIRLKEIDLVQNIPADFSKFHGNLTQLQEVFFNLIDNAYDATKERQVTLKEEGYKGKIEITAKNLNGDIEITVQDNGIGVKDTDKKKLFTPFFTTKATAQKGTGLGLYVIEKIIATHNGKLNMKSVYQSGTTFKITLPIAAPAAA